MVMQDSSCYLISCHSTGCHQQHTSQQQIGEILRRDGSDDIAVCQSTKQSVCLTKNQQE